MSGDSRGSWSGQVGFVLAAAGSAIGLGNIWRFPFATSQNGGGAFVLVYIAAVVLVGMPILISEVLIGRSTARNPVGAFRALAPGSAWPVVGMLGVVAGFVILSYYAVVAGWAFHYLFAAAAGRLTAPTTEGAQRVFDSLTGDLGRQVFWEAVFMATTIAVVARGIEAGIERASKILMPLLFAFLLVLLGYALTSPGAGEGLAFFLTPRFGDLGWAGVLAALGQAFFSLSLGMGAMITYGSYLEQEHSVVKAAGLIVAMDTAIAILAGLVIFPLVFTYGLDPSAAGPGLVFVILPEAFIRMPASSMLATLFFALLLFAALTSAISLLEVVVAYLVDQFGWTRARASWSAGIVIFALGVPSAVSSGFLGWADWIASEVMLPIGGFLIAVFVAWVLPLSTVRSQYEGASGVRGGFRAWRFCVRFVAPVAVAVILLQKVGLF